MKKKKHYPIVIVGGGMVGLTLAKALADANFSIAVIESKAPTLQWQETTLDPRVSAVNPTSMRILKNLGVAENLRDQYQSPLHKMLVWDAIGGGEVDFDAADLGEPELGFIVENREVVRVLWQALESAPNVDLLAGQKVKRLLTTDQHVTLELGDTIITADLLVGADGANSWCREQMQVDMQQRSYYHDAIVAVVQTEKAHQHTALQPFLATGPLGVLPLANPHHVGIVWSAEKRRADALLTMSKDEFDIELMNALNARLGVMQTLTELRSIPLIMRHVKQYVLPRMALIGDAAHTIHPLAGQGVNLGMMDAACLAESLCAARDKGRDIGSLRALRRYERWRKGDNGLMLRAMRSFKELFSSQSPLVTQLRSQGFNIGNRLGPIKNCCMHYAMGERGELPKLAK